MGRASMPPPARVERDRRQEILDELAEDEGDKEFEEACADDLLEWERGSK